MADGTNAMHSEARRAVLGQLAAAYEIWAEREQFAVNAGDYAEAEGAHQYGRWVLRAYVAETDDPEPEDSDAA